MVSPAFGDNKTRALPLASVRADAALREPNPPSVILETHSQILMLAVQLAVAKGTLPRDRVRIYWVSTTEDGRGYAEPVTLNQQGEPEGKWPHAFADKLALSRELLREKLGA